MFMEKESSFEPELVIGFVGAVGVALEDVERKFESYLKDCYGFESSKIKVSALLQTFVEDKRDLNEKNADERINILMDIGNKAREKTGFNDIGALLSVLEISKIRKTEESRRRAYLIRSLKHPDEVYRLRHVYGNGFFLLGVYNTPDSRLDILENAKRVDRKSAERLMERDENEAESFGQKTRATFQLADAFVSLEDLNSLTMQTNRMIDLIFGQQIHTPTLDEHAMFLAYSSSLRSADLSRQVGAVIVSSHGDVLGTGCNEVPKSGGGQYFPVDTETKHLERDREQGKDANENIKNQMIVSIVKKFFPDRANEKDEDLLKYGKQELKGTQLLDITEFGRAVHAEMEAIMSCTRIGISTRGSTLYCTTFPCHNCAKHIVSAGISKVFFVEPYPKSQALKLHGDAIALSKAETGGVSKVIFRPFVGIGPRLYLTLFSMTTHSGKITPRKRNGQVVLSSEKIKTIVPQIFPIAFGYREEEKKAISKIEPIS
jgi:deoxycytidylate deaminase